MIVMPTEKHAGKSVLDMKDSEIEPIAKPAVRGTENVRYESVSLDESGFYADYKYTMVCREGLMEGKRADTIIQSKINWLMSEGMKSRINAGYEIWIDDGEGKAEKLDVANVLLDELESAYKIAYRDGGRIGILHDGALEKVSIREFGKDMDNPSLGEVVRHGNVVIRLSFSGRLVLFGNAISKIAEEIFDGLDEAMLISAAERKSEKTDSSSGRL